MKPFRLTFSDDSIIFIGARKIEDKNAIKIRISSEIKVKKGLSIITMNSCLTRLCFLFAIEKWEQENPGEIPSDVRCLKKGPTETSVEIGEGVAVVKTTITATLPFTTIAALNDKNR